MSPDRRAMRSTLPLLGAVLVAAIALGCTEPRSPEEAPPPEPVPAVPPNRPPDVILLTLDTTRRDHLGLYGYELPTTPVLDELAREAVVFDRAWSTASWTLPSHASMFTGQHPTTHGARFNPEGKEMWSNKVTILGEDAHTLAEILNDDGYATAAFAGGPWLAPEFGLLQGYEVHHAGLSDGKSLLAKDPDEKSTFGVRVNWDAEELTDLALEWIETVPNDRPLHLLINYFDPHVPYELIEGFAVPGAGANVSDPEVATDLEKYDSEIRFMDHQIGRLFEGLRRAGRYDGAVIILVADHGESFGEHDNRYHGPWLYDELLRVPLIVRFPAGRDGGTRVEAPVSVVDLLPMVASEVEVDLPAGVEGVPVGRRELVVGEAFRSEAFNMVLPGKYDRDLITGIRWPWKMIVPDEGEAELYNLETDPAELEDQPDPGLREALASEIESARSRFSPPSNQAFPKNVDPELQERLKALGYTR